MKVFITSILLIISTSIMAVDLGAPIKEASEAYLKNGADAFIPAILKGSPLEGEKSALTQSNNIRQIEAYYGKFLGIEAMREEKLTENVRLIYYVMNYENSPVFGNALLYKKRGREIITNFNFNTDLWQIAPQAVVFD